MLFFDRAKFYAATAAGPMLFGLRARLGVLFLLGSEMTCTAFCTSMVFFVPPLPLPRLGGGSGTAWDSIACTTSTARFLRGSLLGAAALAFCCQFAPLPLPSGRRSLPS